MGSPDLWQAGTAQANHNNARVARHNLLHAFDIKESPDDFVDLRDRLERQTRPSGSQGRRDV
jgi:hypothetical protein